MPQNPYRRRISPQRYQQLLEEARKAATPPEPEPSAMERWGPSVVRGVGGLFGLTPITGMAAGAGSEIIAQAMEGDLDIPRIASATATGALGGTLARTILRHAGRPLKAAVSGGLLGGAAPVAKSVIETGELPEAEEVALGGGIGAVTGGGLAKLLGIMQPRRVAPGPMVGIEPTAQPGGQVLSTRKGKLLPAERVSPISVREPFPTPVSRGAAPAEEAGAIRPEVPPMVQDPAELAAELADIAQRATAAGAVPTRRSAIQAALAAAKKAEQDIAAGRIARVRKDLIPEQAVSETVSAPVPGGTERLTTRFVEPPLQAPGTLVKTRDVPSEAPQGGLAGLLGGRAAAAAPEGPEAIYQAWLTSVGLPDNPAVRSQFPWGLFSVEDVPVVPRIAQAVPEAPRAPVSSPEAPAIPSPALAPETPPQAVVGPREAILEQARPAERALEEIQALTGGAGARAAAQTMSPAGVPEGTPGVQFPLLGRFLRGETITAPEGFVAPALTPRQVSTAARAQATLPAEVNAQLDQLRLASQISADPIERAAIGAKMREIGGAAKGLPPIATQQPLGPPGGPRQRRVPPPSKITPAVAQKQVADIAEELLAKGVPEEEAIATARQTFMDRLRKLGGEGGAGGGEAGAISPELLTRLGLGATGAALGGITDPLGDPILSATAGLGLGLSLPTLARVAGQTFAKLQTDPTVPPKLKEIAQAISTGDQDKIAGSFYRELPSYLRANMLIGPNIFSNFFAGPWGGGMAAGLELRMAGDPMGARILAQMTPANWAQEYKKALPEAWQLVTNAAAMSQERFGTAAFGKFLQRPAVGMMAGDIATRNVLKAAGMSDDMARRYTLTSEPAIKLLHSITNVQKSGPAGQLLLPFARTIANIVEQGMSRTPFLGPLVQASVPALRHPAAVQAQQQFLGAVVPGAAGVAGYLSPEGTSPESRILGGMLRGFTSNVAGPYSGLASVGFGAGKALQGPQAKLGDVVARAGTEALQTLPLPTTDVPASYVSAIRRLLSGELPTRVPSGFIPGAGVINPYIQEQGGNVARRPRRPKRTRRD